MITPLFEIEQDEFYLIFLIKAPFAKVSDAEISIDTKEFVFHSKPYFLRLYLPHEINEIEESARYDVDKGVFIVKIKKKNDGEVFEGLNLLTKLLTPQGCDIITEEIRAENVENQDPNYFFAQKIDSNDESVSSFCCNFQNYYGFGYQRSGVFAKLRDELWNLIDIHDPDSISVEERKRVMFEQEQTKFSEDHYLADLFDKDELTKFLLVKCPWEEWFRNTKDDSALKFNECEISRLKELPKKTFNFNSEVTKSVSLSILDILFAYAYNCRLFECENNVESGWLISKLSPTLCGLINWTSPLEAFLTCFRRSLCFPLFRHWDLSLKVFEDVKLLFKIGKIAILKCFLDIHGIFSTSGDYRYIFNQLYITDYCVWLQYASDNIFQDLYDELCSIDMKKSDVKFDLDELELAAELALKENVVENGPISENVVNTESDFLSMVNKSIGDVREHFLDSDDDDSDDSLGEQGAHGEFGSLSELIAGLKISTKNETTHSNDIVDC